MSSCNWSIFPSSRNFSSSFFILRTILCNSFSSVLQKQQHKVTNNMARCDFKLVHLKVSKRKLLVSVNKFPEIENKKAVEPVVLRSQLQLDAVPQHDSAQCVVLVFQCSNARSFLLIHFGCGKNNSCEAVTQILLPRLYRV